MKIIYSGKFAREYKRLSVKIKTKAEAKELVFRKNPFDARLKTHKLTGKLQKYWSFSIDHKHRIVFQLKDEKTIWFHSVGSHQIYR
ncbi:MAG: type II toxin-antitoxin system mRNA interferase toxin, RelE/StbE family [Patescibacteria group bacterium]|nr:type II toxin-antitoxin system mRNA interferase toxin, RelE/StbE family [Patescibacteria group bacterium]